MYVMEYIVWNMTNIFLTISKIGTVDILERKRIEWYDKTNSLNSFV